MFAGQDQAHVEARNLPLVRHVPCQCRDEYSSSISGNIAHFKLDNLILNRYSFGLLVKVCFTTLSLILYFNFVVTPRNFIIA